jgi:hypothetical protein
MFFKKHEDELHVVLGNRTVAISSMGENITPNDIVTKEVTDNPIFARTVAQAERLMEVCSLPKEKKQAVSKAVSGYCDRLIRLSQMLDYLWQEIVRCDSEFNTESKHINLPQVRNLEATVENFLVEAKKALIDVSKLLGIFFDYTQTGPNYDLHYKWAIENFDADSIVVGVLKDHTSGDRWIKYICDLRNRVEHENDSQKLTIENITLKPDKRLLAPTWALDSSQVATITMDMETIIHNILILSEDLLAGCINEKPLTPIIGLRTVPNEEIKPEMPFRWKAVLLKDKAVFTESDNSQD